MPNIGKNVEQLELTDIAEVKYAESVCQFVSKQHISSLWPRIFQSYIFTQESYIVFIADLFVIAPNIWKQPKYPTTGEWKNK